MDAVVADRDKRDLEIDRVWAQEAGSRWAAHEVGQAAMVSYDHHVEASETMAKHHRSLR